MENADSRNYLYELRRIGPPSTLKTVRDVMRLLPGCSKFGRSFVHGAENEFYLDSAKFTSFISRRHAEIYIKDNGDCLLVDLGLNGSYVNNIRVDGTCPLVSGDKVTFGHRRGVMIKPGCLAPQPDSEFQFVFQRIVKREKTSDACDNGPSLPNVEQDSSSNLCQNNTGKQQLCHKDQGGEQLCGHNGSGVQLCRNGPAEQQLCHKDSRQQVCRKDSEEQQLCHKDSRQQVCRKDSEEQQLCHKDSRQQVCRKDSEEQQLCHKDSRQQVCRKDSEEQQLCHKDSRQQVCRKDSGEQQLCHKEEQQLCHIELHFNNVSDREESHVSENRNVLEKLPDAHPPTLDSSKLGIHKERARELLLKNLKLNQSNSLLNVSSPVSSPPKQNLTVLPPKLNPVVSLEKCSLEKTLCISSPNNSPDKYATESCKSVQKSLSTSLSLTSDDSRKFKISNDCKSRLKSPTHTKPPKPSSASPLSLFEKFKISPNCKNRLKSPPSKSPSPSLLPSPNLFEKFRISKNLKHQLKLSLDATKTSKRKKHGDDTVEIISDSESDMESSSPELVTRCDEASLTKSICPDDNSRDSGNMSSDGSCPETNNGENLCTNNNEEREKVQEETRSDINDEISEGELLPDISWKQTPVSFNKGKNSGAIRKLDLRVLITACDSMENNNRDKNSSNLLTEKPPPNITQNEINNDVLHNQRQDTRTTGDSILRIEETEYYRFKSRPRKRKRIFKEKRRKPVIKPLIKGQKKRGRPPKQPKLHVHVPEPSEELVIGKDVDWYEGEQCASINCSKPNATTIPWVQCDLCDSWYHTSCVGCNYDLVKDENIEFRCGCA